jgi:hypothetical protein
MMLGAGATAAALSASIRPASAAASPLLDLIENHQRVHAAYIVSLDIQEEVEFAYRDAFPAKELVVPLSIGGGVTLNVHSVDDCRAAIAAAYKAKEKALPSVVGSLGIASADEVTRRLRKAQTADLRVMRRMVAEDMAQREAFGLLPAARAVKAASEAEDDAAAALLAYPCLTREEIRMRAGYVTSPGSGYLIYDGLTSGTDFLINALLFASEGGEA